MTEEANGKMIYVWGDPTFVVSNFDPANGHKLYAKGCVAVTSHYDGNFENAGSLSAKSAFFIDYEMLPDLIAALSQFVEGNGP